MVRWSHGSELLAVAVAHFDLFSRLARRAMTLDEIAGDVNIAARPANVLIVALRAMKLIDGDATPRPRP